MSGLASVRPRKAVATGIPFLLSAIVCASEVVQYCSMSKHRVQNVLELAGMEPAIDTAIQLVGGPDATREAKLSALPMLGCTEDDAYARFPIAALDDPDRNLRGRAIIGIRHLAGEKTISFRSVRGRAQRADRRAASEVAALHAVFATAGLCAFRHSLSG